jgi:DNA-directed RNA polymerase specialized sigma24 family protein
MKTSLAEPAVARADQAQPVTDWLGQRAARFERDVLSQPGRMYRAARCLAADRAAAEDLVKETVARAYAALGQVEPGATMTADG